MSDRWVVVGFGVTGRAVAAHLRARREAVVVIEDRANDDHRAAARDLGVELVEAPHPGAVADIVRAATAVVPSPGVPPRHPVYAAATGAGVPLLSEVELGARIATDRGIPLVAVTGTNGKTTVTTLVAEMLCGAGVRAVAAGNIGRALIEAASDAADVFVVEVSSFQLEYTDRFRPRVAAWLNVSPDHLDWHPSAAAYAAAKARIWRNQQSGDTAVVNADDPVVVDHAASAPGAVVTFGTDRADYRFDGSHLTHGSDRLLPVNELPRAMPHDIANALAAWATAEAAGAPRDAVAAALRSFAGLPHRVERIGESGGVTYYDDSKATTPASVLAALGGFESVVLIAGGRNKGLDLGALREAADHIRAVVAIGESAGDVERAFAGVRPVQRAGSMADAVDAASALARPGDAVLLSPGCASYDWYRNYGERGDDFKRIVRARLGAA